MNRFFRSAFFPLIVIVLLVYLASRTLIQDQGKEQKTTYSELQQLVKNDPESIKSLTFVPNKFVIGYGLDFAERYRNLPYVGVLDEGLIP